MKYQIGQRVTGKINNVTDLGIFVSLAHNTSGLIHHNDFGDNWLHEKYRYQVGEAIRVVVINNFKGKIGLSRVQINDPALIDHTNEFSTTKKEDFLTVLAKTAADAEKEIKKLQQELTAYAN